MHIVVCLKGVPTNIRNPAPNSDGSGIIVEGDTFINSSDEYALELALLLKRNRGGKVTAVTVGPIKSQDILHVAIAKGADEVIRIDADEYDPNIIAILLSHAIDALDFNLILTGVESSDGMSSQVGVSLGARLHIPCVYAVTKVDAANNDDDTFIATRELGGGRLQILEVLTPALFCVQSGIVELTYTPVVKLIHARRRAVPCQSLSDLGLDSEMLKARRKTKILAIKPTERSSTTQWLSGNPEQLAAQIIEKIGKVM